MKHLFQGALRKHRLALMLQMAALEAVGLSSEVYSIVLSDDITARDMLRPLIGGSLVLCSGMCLLITPSGWRRVSMCVEQNRTSHGCARFLRPSSSELDSA